MRQFVENIANGMRERRIERKIRNEMDRLRTYNHYDLFRKAAITGDNALATLIVESGHIYPQNLLYHLITYADDIPVLRMVLTLGADTNIPNDQGIMPISDALSYEVSIVLLDAGADPFLKNDGYPFGMDAFDFAAYLGRSEVLQALSERADINRLDDEGLAPLHRTALGTNAAPNAEAFFLLLEASADPLLPDSFGRTGLALARKAGWPECLDGGSMIALHPMGWAALERATLELDMTVNQKASSKGVSGRDGGI